MTSVYSDKPLWQKLGIKPGMVVVALGAPKNYRDLLAPLPEGVRLLNRLSNGLACIHSFSTSAHTLGRELSGFTASLAPDGILWISWPKKTSGLKTDLEENIIRDIGLAHGLVDVKVCAVDDTWSALKFVRRLQDRKRQ